MLGSGDNEGVYYLGEPLIYFSNYRLSLRPTEQINALNTYLDLVKVTLPEWVLDFQHQQLPPNPPKSNTSSKTTKQIQSVAKQFGSIGKKLKKNISKLGKSNHRFI